MSWYQSTIPKEWILKIKICLEVPSLEWDEQWYSEEISAHCARFGSELFLIGQSIPVVPGMFQGFLSLKEIDGLELLDSSQSSDLSYVFAGCISLKQVDLSSWDTSMAETMEALFDGCTHLETASMDNWSLSRCCTLSAMFRECNRLQRLDVSHWDVSQVQDFSDAFSCCSALKRLDISHWNTSNARTMQGMFNRCSSLIELNVSRWNTAELINLSQLFHHCGSLTHLDLAGWSFEHAADVSNMFLGMYGTITLPCHHGFRTLLPRNTWVKKYLLSEQLCRISSIELIKETKAPSWYDRCWSIDEAESGFLFAVKQGDKLCIYSRGSCIYANEDSSMLFSFADEHENSWLQRIEGLDLLNTCNTKDFSFMFSGNAVLSSLELNEFDFSHAQTLAGMFLNCKNLKEIGNKQWKLPSDADTQGMYQGCHNLQNE